jgi:uncharacterized membrane protein (DUF373 family)
MHHFIEKVERGVLWVLALLLLASVVLGTVDLIVSFVQILYLPPVLMIKPDTLFYMFGEFLIVLMGLKLIHLVLLSLPDRDSSVVAVIEVALIGVGQKVVTMDVKKYSAASFLGVAALILALSIAYVACRQTQRAKDKPAPDG